MKERKKRGRNRTKHNRTRRHSSKHSQIFFYYKKKCMPLRNSAGLSQRCISPLALRLFSSNMSGGLACTLLLLLLFTNLASAAAAPSFFPPLPVFLPAFFLASEGIIAICWHKKLVKEWILLGRASKYGRINREGDGANRKRTVVVVHSPGHVCREK